MIGGQYQKADTEHLYTYCRKHGLKMNRKDIEIILNVYSSKKDKTLRSDDLWNIFKPLTVKMVDEIIEVREHKYILSKCHQTHFRITDLLCAILEKTV